MSSIKIKEKPPTERGDVSIEELRSQFREPARAEEWKRNCVKKNKKDTNIEVLTLCEASTQALLVDTDTSVQVATVELSPPISFKPKKLMVIANYCVCTLLSLIVGYYFSTLF